MASACSRSSLAQLLLLLFTLPFTPAAAVPWEWAGTFDLAAGDYTWSFAKATPLAGSGHDYADASAKMLIYPISDSSKPSLEAVESNAETAWAGTATAKSSYGKIVPSTSSPGLYTLTFDANTWSTHFVIEVATAGAYAVFLEHNPLEFEKGFHFMKDETGTDVEAVVEEGGGGHGHDHGAAEVTDAGQCPWGHEWEWSGIFEVTAGSWLDWNAEKVGTDYADAHMKIVLLATTGTDLAALETQAHTHWDAITAADEVEAGQTIPIGKGSELHFEAHTWASHFKIEVPAGTTKIAVFAQHFPTEFERHTHYLRKADGVDIEPVALASGAPCATTTEAAAASTDKDRWGEVLLSSFITVIPTLIGIGVIVAALLPTLKGLAEDGTFLATIHSFASGVIFAAAVFLLLPEGLYLVSEGKTEAGGSGAWGTAVLAGWITCAVIEHVVQVLSGEDSGNQGEQEGKKRINWSVALPILFGDGFHNMADGLVIGTAFKSCKISMAWKLTYVTVLHEVPQELSDFAVLVTRGRMHWGPATILNFISGLTTVLGAIIAYEVDVDSGVEGVILAGGAGVYLYVAMTELGPVVSKLMGGGVKGALARLAAFAVGAILIGLVLLDHEHCGPEPLPGEEGEESGGGGHHHRLLWGI